MQLTYHRKTGTSSTAVIFLHGSNQSKESFSYQLNSPLLSTFDLWSIDLPGHGESPRLSSYSMHTITEAVTTFLRRQNFTKVVLVGHSLGGHVALACHSLGYPVAGLVLMSVPPASKPISLSELFQADPAVSLLYKNEMSNEEMHQLASAQYQSVTDISQEVRSIKQVCPKFREQLPASFFQGEHIHEQEAISNLKTPTFIATAKHDRFVNNEHILTHLPPKAMVKSYSSGHNIHREATTDFNADLRRFVDDIVR